MEESKYAYMLSENDIFRIKIPDFNRAHEPPQFKLECVCKEISAITSSGMGIFSNGPNVYLFGGKDDDFNKSMYIFNPEMAEEYPIRDTKLLHKSSVEYIPMVFPCALQARQEIYLFSTVCSLYRPIESLCWFQSFNPYENRFRTLPTPSLNESPDFGVRAYFLVKDHIYLFIENCGDEDRLQAFSFNTRSLKWNEMKSLLSKFEEHKIPIPYNHRGDIGLSYKFHDHTKILVALKYGTPTAYRVWHGAAGSDLQPKSYRPLLEHNCDRWHNVSRLLDIGCKRFCVIFSSYAAPLLVYAFKMNFEVEYENQLKSVSLAMPSIEILCSRKFMPPIGLYDVWTTAYSFCFASAPPGSKSCFPCDEVECSNNDSNKREPKWEPKREPGVVFLEV